MIKYFPFIHEDKKSDSEPLLLYIEAPRPPFPLKKEEKEKVERGVVIIEL